MLLKLGVPLDERDDGGCPAGVRTDAKDTSFVLDNIAALHRGRNGFTHVCTDMQRGRAEMQAIELLVSAEMYVSLVAMAAIIGLTAIANGKGNVMDVNGDELRRAARQKKGGYVWRDKLDRMWRRSDEISSLALDLMTADDVSDRVRKLARQIVEMEREQTNDIVLLRNMEDRDDG